jgi:hypothetical protein
MAKPKPSPPTAPTSDFKIDGAAPQDAEYITRDRQIAALQARLAEAKRNAQRHLAAALEAEERFQNLAALKEATIAFPPVLSVAGPTTEHRGLPMAVWSDWHVEEVVEAGKTRGLNRYSPTIAARRAEACARSTVKLFRHVGSSYKVDTLLLWLGGDFITGYIHEELAQTNAMAPVEGAQFAQRLLIAALQQIESEKSIRHCRIICHRGNHARTTRKMQFKNDFETSFETWIYANLRDIFRGSKKLQFVIPEADVHLETILPGYRVRSFHGHQVRYQDGVGGLTIPLNKWEARQDKTTRADFNILGHWHNYSQPNSTSILNGSLKGYDEFAASFGFAYQPPLQAFALFDTRRRMVAQHMPIFCE